MMRENGTDIVLDPMQLQAELVIRMDQARFDEIIGETPRDFHEIAHYAALWGISDDGYRESMVRNASQRARENLKYVVGQYEDRLENWLAGDDADGPEFSEAFVAFSAMIMASDEVS